MPPSGRGIFLADTVLLSAKDIRKALKRVSHELVEAHPDTSDLLLIGILSRGEPLARRIANNISGNGNGRIPVAALDTRPFRDDLPSPPQPSNGKGLTIAGGVAGRNVVLVDDVLFTGRTVRAALDAIVKLGRPRSVQLLVLIDRGHRELPIRADFVGKNIPTSLDQTVKVRLEEMDGRDEVVLFASGVPSTDAERVAGGAKWR